MNKLNKFLEIARGSAYRAGQILKKSLDRKINIEFKGETNLVTEMDKRSEEMITEEILRHFPAHRIVGEEGTEVSSDSPCSWFIDPLDGTTNYAHHLPWFAVSLGLVIEEIPRLGVVYNPMNEEMFWATEGEGAFCNGEKISVSCRENIPECLLATGFPYCIRECSGRVIANLEKMMIRSRGIRRFGSAALDLCYVAKGIYDGFWEEGLYPWDTCGGMVILQEAGGRLSDYNGNPFHPEKKTIIASNGRIHDAMVEVLRSDL